MRRALSRREAWRRTFGRPHVVTCALPSCSVPIERGKLFCRHHWFALSREVRMGLVTSFVNRDGQAYAGWYQDALNALQPPAIPAMTPYELARATGDWEAAGLPAPEGRP